VSFVNELPERELHANLTLTHIHIFKQNKKIIEKKEEISPFKYFQ